MRTWQASDYRRTKEKSIERETGNSFRHIYLQDDCIGCPQEEVSILRSLCCCVSSGRFLSNLVWLQISALQRRVIYLFSHPVMPECKLEAQVQTATSVLLFAMLLFRKRLKTILFQPGVLFSNRDHLWCFLEEELQKCMS